MYILASSWEILFLLCGLGILQGVLLALLILFHRRSDRSVNLFLALYIFCTSAVITIPFVIKAIGWENGYWIPPFPVLSGPLLYLYLRSFKERITWRKALPHLLLFFIFYFVSYWNITRLSVLYTSTEGIPAEALRNPITIIIFIARPVQQIIYYFLSRKILLSYQRSIRHLFSETSRIDLQWTRFLLNGYLILVLAFLIIYPLILRFPEQVYLLLAVNMTIAVPYIYMVTAKGIMQPSIWQLLPGTDKESVEKEIIQAEEIDTAEEKPATSEKPGLSAEKLSEITRNIILLMEKEKLYQETELTLRQLAINLNIPNYQVSLALKEGMKKNFYDLINGYRVEEAKRLLLHPGSKTYTILSVGFEAGFNSKTTFNTVFKKFTGLTPTEFRDKQKTSSVPA